MSLSYGRRFLVEAAWGFGHNRGMTDDGRQGGEAKRDPGGAVERAALAPRRGPQARTEAELRRARQAASLRENLHRRKARGRIREEPSPKPDAPDPSS